MADTTNNIKKLVTLDTLKVYDGSIKRYIDEKNTDAVKDALKFADFKNNTLSFYREFPVAEDATPAISIDFPEERFLDQVATKVVNNFDFAAGNYPEGTVDPELDGKSVFVIGVKGDNGTTYSFVSLGEVLSTIAGAETDTAKVSISDGNTISVDVKISDAEGNLLTTKEGSDGKKGLYVNSPAADLSKKADKLVDPETIDENHPAVIMEGQVLVDDGSGNLKGSGVVLKDIKDATDGLVDKIGEIPTVTDPESGEEKPVADNIIQYITYVTEKKSDEVKDSFEYATEDDINDLFKTDSGEITP